MTNQMNTNSNKPKPALRSTHRSSLNRVTRTLLLIGVFMEAGLHAQLKTTQYAQLPAAAIEPIIIKPSGVYPQKIVRPQGPFVLYVENRLPGHTAHLSLTPNLANAPELTGLDTTAPSPRSFRLLDLMPGSYLLHIPNAAQAQNAGSQNPAGWSVLIEITN